MINLIASVNTQQVYLLLCIKEYKSLLFDLLIHVTIRFLVDKATFVWFHAKDTQTTVSYWTNSEIVAMLNFFKVQYRRRLTTYNSLLISQMFVNRGAGGDPNASIFEHKSYHPHHFLRTVPHMFLSSRAVLRFYHNTVCPSVWLSSHFIFRVKSVTRGMVLNLHISASFG